MEFVVFRLTAKQLAEIHNSVTKGVEHLRISRADAVVGLLARCLSEVEPESKPIDTLSYLVNVRALIYPFLQFGLFCYSTAEWVYTRITRRSTGFFGAP